MRKVRVFVSSPGDAVNERKRIIRIIEKLNAALAGTVTIQPVLWEERFYSAHQGFQSQIERSADCDVVIAILRGRIGTPLAQDFIDRLPHEDILELGDIYPSGTTYEIVSAIAARKRGAPLPDIYVFRYPKDPMISLDDPNRDEVENQWKMLKRFVEEVFVAKEGHFKGAYHTFVSTDDFEMQAERALRQWLAENVLRDRALPWPIVTKGSPFRGLEAFGAKHSDVFFGRDGDRNRASDRLKDLAEAGYPFLMIVGPSGAGKSSIARAGLLPWLTKPGSVSGVGAWRAAVMRPSDHLDGAIASLARHLFDDKQDLPKAEEGRPVALPELAFGDHATPKALAGLFSAFARGNFQCEEDDEAAAHAAIAPLVKALRLVGENDRREWNSDRQEPARLLLIIDQMDELFAPGVDDLARRAFARLVTRLARSGLVWVLATLRAELYESFLNSPLASVLAEAPDSARKVGLTFELIPPGLSEMASVVRGPAAAAGLEWEVDPVNKMRLDERLLKDIEQSDLLPLVQFVLDRLFEQRVIENGRVTLTYAAYRALGTLDGAIDKTAEGVMGTLGVAEAAALPRLLRRLVSHANANMVGNGAITLVAAPRKIVDVDEASSRLIDALIDARILVSARDELRRATLSVAHQRVIDSWKRAKEIVTTSSGLLRVRDEIESQRSRWEESGRRRDRLIPSGLPLSEAEDALARLGGELSADVRTYIVRSGRAARSRQTLTAAAAVVFMVVSALAAFMWTRASEATRQALIAKEDTRKQRDAALLSQSRYLADLSRQKTAEGDAGDGILLALEALPDSTSAEEVKRTKAFWPDAELALDKALHAYREVAILRGHAEAVTGVAFAADSDKVVSSSADGFAHAWDLGTGRITTTFRGHDNSVICIAVFPDGKRAVTGSRDNTARVWDLTTGAELFKLTGHSGEIHSVAISPDGNFIVTASYDKTLRIWDARTGALSRTLEGHSADIYSVAISPDGRRIVSGSRDDTARVWDAISGAELFVLRYPNALITSVAFSSDGARIFMGSADGKLGIWSATSGQILSAFDAHKDQVSAIAISPDGTMIVSAGFDDDIRLWDATTNAPLATLKGHRFPVTSLGFSRDGSRLVSGSRDATLRVWEIRRDDALRILRGHTAEIDAVAISPRNDFAVTGDRRGMTRVWELHTGALRAELKGHTNSVDSVAVTNDGKKIVTASEDHTVRIWDAATGDQLSALNCGVWRAVSVAVSPDGARIFAGLSDGTIKVWDAASGKELLTLHGHSGAVIGLAVTPDGSRVVSSGDDRSARIWDANSGEQLKEWKGEGILFYSAISPDGSKFAFGSGDGRARMFDLGTYKFLRSFDHHGSGALGIAFTPDSRRLVTSSENRFLRVWDVDSGLLLSELQGHQKAIRNLAVSPDGARIVTVSADSTARIWELLPAGQALMDYAKTRVPRCLKPDERAEYSLTPRPEPWCGKLDKWPYDAVTARIGVVESLGAKADADAEIYSSTTLAAHPEFKKDFDEAMADAYVDRGLNDLQQGNAQGAVEQFKLAIGHVPASKARIDSAWGEILFDQGQSALNKSDDDEAQSTFAAAEQHDAKLADKIGMAWATVYYQRGVIALRAGKEQEARGLFDKAIARKPDLAKQRDDIWASAYLLSGAQLFDSGDEIGANQRFELAKKLKPELTAVIDKATTEALVKRGLRQFGANPDQDFERVSRRGVETRWWLGR